MYKEKIRALQIPEKPLFGTKKRIGIDLFGPLASAASGWKGRFFANSHFNALGTDP
jgi:hypothetical protein